MTRKRQKRRIGDILKIDLGDGSLAFARVLEEPLIAFYDLRADVPIAVERIIQSPIAFKIWVMNYAVTSGEWPVIGHAPLDEDLKEEPRFFKKDAISGQLSIYWGNGCEKPATLEDIEGLECAAVWEPEHVVDRLRDHFAGRPNMWVESLRPKPRTH